jgi:hypothetical protein
MWWLVNTIPCLAGWRAPASVGSSLHWRAYLVHVLACPADMGSLIKKRRKRMRKKKHKKMLKATRWRRRAGK